MQRSPFALLLAAGIVLGACTGAATAPAAAAGSAPTVDIVTSLGTIEVVLDPVHAPITVKNFMKYVDKKFYSGGTFFRAVPGFVIQGGNKAKEHTPAAEPPIELETPVKTGVKNVDGAISMARTSDPNSATSEFFLCDGDQAVLDGTGTVPGYAAFGHVTKNLDLVKKIARMPAADQALVNPVRILKIVRVR
jgi:peptidyl-prolyl cis-trans isomerase A (cyclophilin A)